MRSVNGEWLIAAEDRTDAAGEDTALFQAITQDGIVMGLTDLMVISRALGTRFSPVHLTEALTSWTASDWLQDLMSFWVAEGTQQMPCTTAAGQEIARLREIERELLPQLESLQLRRFGQVVHLNLDGIWSERH